MICLDCGFQKCECDIAHYAKTGERRLKDGKPMPTIHALREQIAALTAELKSLTEAYNNTNWKKKNEEQKDIISKIVIGWGKKIRRLTAENKRLREEKLRHCACEFEDGLCVSPCKFHGVENFVMWAEDHYWNSLSKDKDLIVKHIKEGFCKDAIKEATDEPK